MPATYEPIATTTLGAAASSITFSSIPGTYTDLRLVVVAKATGSNAAIRFNGTTTGYSLTQLLGNGTAASSTAATNASFLNATLGFNIASSNFQLFTFDIFSYAGSTNKTTLITYSGDLNGSGNVVSSVGLWQNTAAINQVVFLGSTFDAGTTATLYGILRA